MVSGKSGFLCLNCIGCWLALAYVVIFLLFIRKRNWVLELVHREFCRIGALGSDQTDIFAYIQIHWAASGGIGCSPFLQ